VSHAPLVVVGDVLLDREVSGTVDRLCPEAPVPVLDQREVLDRPGGAGLAALFTASCVDGAHVTPRRSPREVVLVAAVGADAAGERIRELVTRAGVRLVEVPLLGPTPEKIRLRAGEHLLLRLDRGGAPGGLGPVPADAVSAIHAAGTILVSDYGHGIATSPRLRAALTERAQGVPVVWDPHPHGGQPVAATRLVVPNRSEAEGFTAGGSASPGFAASGFAASGSAASKAGGEWSLATVPYDRPAHTGSLARTARTESMAHTGNGASGNGYHALSRGDDSHHGRCDPATADLAQVAGMAVRLRRYWTAGAVAVTLAEHGAVLSDGVHPPLLVPAPFNARGDSCGVGNRFASTAVVSLSDGSSALDAVMAGVIAATAYVAAGGVLALYPELHEGGSPC
jgi:bifunctional ADP-heptose synthase (sugar kinase/adenylyltransferase)